MEGLWKANALEPDVEGDEYETVAEELDHYCRDAFSLNPKFPEDFYVRGDFTGDRTQVVEISNPSIVSMELLNELQKWLWKYHENWRILIPTYLDEPGPRVVSGDNPNFEVTRYHAGTTKGYRFSLAASIITPMVANART